jgi:hypothetical protein
LAGRLVWDSVKAMAFPQYRIPIHRLQEEWAFRKRMERLRRRQAPSQTPRITDNSEPWVRNPASVAEFLEIASKVNHTVAKWGTRPQNSSEG